MNQTKILCSRLLMALLLKQGANTSAATASTNRVGFGSFRLGVAGFGLVGHGKVVMGKVAERQVTELGGHNTPSNGGKEQIEMEVPYVAEVTILGTAPLLFHAWNVESVAEKSAAKKGSKAKKEDDVNSYVYRDDKGYLCLPGEYLRMSIINAAKFRQDPRSPRKSAMDLFKAAIISMTALASLGVKDWDYLDRRRVVIQRNAITRSRPAFKEGWKATIQLMCNLPEYIGPAFLNEVITQAGKLVGVGDFRPSFGRFQIVEFKIVDLD